MLHSLAGQSWLLGRCSAASRRVTATLRAVALRLTSPRLLPARPGPAWEQRQQFCSGWGRDPARSSQVTVSLSHSQAWSQGHVLSSSSPRPHGGCGGRVGLGCLGQHCPGLKR